MQDHAAQINEIGAEIQIDTAEYNWMSQRYAALKGQYDQAFGLMAPREGKDYWQMRLEYIQLVK